MAAWLKKQKPIGVAVSAWWPGGRVATKALLARFSITSSTASTAPPTQRIAASESAGRHRGVAVEPHHAFLRADVADLRYIVERMAQRDGLDRRHRGFDPDQRLEPFMLQRPFDGAQPVRALRVAGRDQMVQAGLVTHEQCRHGELSSVPGRWLLPGRRSISGQGNRWMWPGPMSQNRGVDRVGPDCLNPPISRRMNGNRREAPCPSMRLRSKSLPIISVVAAAVAGLRAASFWPWFGLRVGRRQPVAEAGARARRADADRHPSPVLSAGISEAVAGLGGGAQAAAFPEPGGVVEGQGHRGHGQGRREDQHAVAGLDAGCVARLAGPGCRPVGARLQRFWRRDGAGQSRPSSACSRRCRCSTRTRR